MKRTFLVAAMLLATVPAHADCVKGMPFCFNGDGQKQTVVPLQDGILDATGGQAWMDDFKSKNNGNMPKPEDVKDACRDKIIDGLICKAGHHGHKFKHH